MPKFDDITPKDTTAKPKTIPYLKKFFNLTDVSDKQQPSNQVESNVRNRGDKYSNSGSKVYDDIEAGDDNLSYNDLNTINKYMEQQVEDNNDIGYSKHGRGLEYGSSQLKHGTPLESGDIKENLVIGPASTTTKKSWVSIIINVAISTVVFILLNLSFFDSFYPDSIKDTTRVLIKGGIFFAILMVINVMI